MTKNYHRIRQVRRIVAAVFAVVLTASVALGARCVATRMQLLPAIMAGSAVWLAVWSVATLLMGRIYCSTACPMGSLMDIIALTRRAVRRLRHMRPARYRYVEPNLPARYAVLVGTAACILLGFSIVASLLDPFSAYARAVGLLRSFVHSPAGRATGVGVLSAVVALATLGIVAAVAWRRGRHLCSTWCPVGSALSVVSRYSLYHADVNTDMCVRCMRCVDACKAECINPTHMTVDSARCVVCFDCMDVCPTGAMSYRRDRHRLSTPLVQPTRAASAPSLEATGGEPVRMDRRKFMRLGVVVAAGTVAGVATRMRGQSQPWDPMPLQPLNAPVPPGCSSRKSFLRRCTACGACVAACPTGVLKPSLRQYGIVHSMQPVMDFGQVACATDCMACTQVCPTKALVPLTLDEKRRFVIGKARIRLQNCLAYGKGETCGRCARRCRYEAIEMTVFSDGRRGPQVDLTRCVGCGQCEAVCPALPYKAIVIEGTD
ncbi:MAG: 4Fe-4S dicluster domain-containing protein [Muribaculaceae bacterium]|nr:4Fe-4S dicluster domain-containing protein [Muribaculaceae bacterium]